ncbi:flagellar protein FlaG [Pectinatus haikarae]|uniref:Flagellar protein FlaG n=1 Tax=Pectinatus haikarae TaxID=349096 RepID=A0ABT9Y4S5_9FIRM|nr:flagellar protein FlaG [Pectinatus haikarae]MDQ0202836.1 flagellar protein FlaG [Pectinatus haikarae]
MITNLQNVNSSNTHSGASTNTPADPVVQSAVVEAENNTISALTAAAASANETKQDEKNNLSDGTVKDMTDKLNEMADDMNLQLKFVWYRQLDQLGVKMVDISTNKTIKSFPPEDIMKALIRTKEWVGKFLDKEI